MGCKPSKISQVATGNTISSSSRKRTTETKAIEIEIAELKKAQENDINKDMLNFMTQNSPCQFFSSRMDKGFIEELTILSFTQSKEVQGNAIAKEEHDFMMMNSPDQYFSSRMDEMTIEESATSFHACHNSRECMFEGNNDSGDEELEDSASLRNTLIISMCYS